MEGLDIHAVRELLSYRDIEKKGIEMKKEMVKRKGGNKLLVWEIVSMLKRERR